MQMEMDGKQKIDFVVPWVDGSDPDWLRQKRSYSKEAGDQSASRYRDWETLRYWFRSIENYAPWVNHVYFITCGQCPDWLNLECETLRFIRHEDYIPDAYLPTFSSHVIELNLHRMKGLSEQFVYFNDDVFLTSPVKQEDFFKNGCPCDRAVMNAVANTDIENFMPYIMMNNMAVINMRFNKQKVLKENRKKWFTMKYGKNLGKNILLSPWKYFTGFCNFHICTPFLKSTLETVWEKEEKILDQTCRHRFRSREDVNQYLFRYWQFADGRFCPGGITGSYLTIGQDSREKIYSTLTGGQYQAVCINDDPFPMDFQKEKENLISALDRILPNPSRYER